MKKCELCNSPAKLYCHSDQASLCWSCDSKVHSANFLVARHCRSVLCYVCHCRTPWSASGSEFGPTVSVCSRCVRQNADKIRMRDASEETDGGYEPESDSGNRSTFYQEEVSDSDDRDLKVVPCSATPSPPPASSSSSSDKYSTERLSDQTDADSSIRSLKRSRHSCSDLPSHSVEPLNKRRSIGSAASGTRTRRHRRSGGD